MERKAATTREEVLSRLKMAKTRKAKVVEEMKQQLTELSIKLTGSVPTDFEVL